MLGASHNSAPLTSPFQPNSAFPYPWPLCSIHTNHLQRILAFEIPDSRLSSGSLHSSLPVGAPLCANSDNFLIISRGHCSILFTHSVLLSLLGGTIMSSILQMRKWRHRKLNLLKASQQKWLLDIFLACFLLIPEFFLISLEEISVPWVF